MASKRFVGTMAILAFVLPVVAMATEFTVGDDQGWTINFDYEAWAKEKVFHVGDKLGNIVQALSYDFMFLLSLPFIPAAKSIMVNSHTCSLQIHGRTT